MDIFAIMNSDFESPNLYDIYSMAKKFQAKHKNAPTEQMLMFYSDGTQIEKNGDASHVVFSPDFEKLRDGGIIHNHPSGNAFSVGDFKAYAVCKLSWMVATVNDGFYIVSGSSARIGSNVISNIDRKSKELNRSFQKEFFERYKKHLAEGGDSTNFNYDDLNVDFREKWVKYMKRICSLRGLEFKFITL